MANSSVVDIKIVDPGAVSDWDARLLTSGDIDFFHTSAWARTLTEAYGFQPIYHVNLHKGKFSFLMPMMEIRSAFTGRRGVALPFTDRCTPYSLDPYSLSEARDSVISYGLKNHWRHIEWRDNKFFDDDALPWETFFFHEIDLRQSSQALFAGLSENNRRNIRKSLKEGVAVSSDASRDSLSSFCRLNHVTRKRHGLPPQPLCFFRSVFNNILANGMGRIFVASIKGRTIAAAIFFHFGTNALYKYGASDLRYQKFRPNNLIMWEALKWYQDRSFHVLDLGRSEINNPGLLQFKRTWGGTESLIKYFRYDLKKCSLVSKQSHHTQPATKLMSAMPVPVLRILGRMFYRHVA